MEMADKPQSLIDVQSTPDERGIDIQRVGVKNVEMPLHILQKDGHTQMVAASVSMSVALPKEHKGTHLSRFIIQLAEHYKSKAFCYNLREFLEETRERLQAEVAYVDIDFRYFMDKKAPVTGLAAPMAFPCSFRAALVGQAYTFTLGVELPIATLCPCSKAISDYGAHNQRAMLRAEIDLDIQAEQPVLWIEDVIAALDECASCPVYPILKRADEKYVTERAYDNPKFVEDVIREAIAILRKTPGVLAFNVEVEALESIHGHNAWATHREAVTESVLVTD